MKLAFKPKFVNLPNGDLWRCSGRGTTGQIEPFFETARLAAAPGSGRLLKRALSQITAQDAQFD
jgi:hypothetical protein